MCVCLFLYYTTVLLAVNDMDVHVEGGDDVVWSLSWCYLVNVQYVGTVQERQSSHSYHDSTSRGLSDLPLA